MRRGHKDNHPEKNAEKRPAKRRPGNYGPARFPWPARPSCVFWAPQPDAACYTGSTCTTPTNTTTYPVNLTTAASAPATYKIYDTSANTGMGSISIGATHPASWWLNVPANAYAGTYTSTITYQLTSAP